jgi:hypothetical protein
LKIWRCYSKGWFWCDFSGEDEENYY